MNEKGTTKKRSINVWHISDAMRKTASFQAMMSRPLSFATEDDISEGLAVQLMQRWIFEKMDKDKSFSSQYPDVSERFKWKESIKNNNEHKENVQLLTRGWKNWEKGAQYVLSKKFTDGVKVSTECDLDGSQERDILHVIYPSNLTTSLKEMTKAPPQASHTVPLGAPAPVNFNFKK